MTEQEFQDCWQDIDTSILPELPNFFEEEENLQPVAETKASNEPQTPSPWQTFVSRGKQRFDRPRWRKRHRKLKQMQKEPQVADIKLYRRSLEAKVQVQIFQCKECKAKLASQQSWRRHVQGHQPLVHPWVCPFPDCKGKSFRLKGGLSRHLRSSLHLNLQPYGCPKCYRFYSDMSNLRWHMKTQHISASKKAWQPIVIEARKTEDREFRDLLRTLPTDEVKTNATKQAVTLIELIGMLNEITRKRYANMNKTAVEKAAVIPTDQVLAFQALGLPPIQ